MSNSPAFLRRIVFVSEPALRISFYLQRISLRPIDGLDHIVVMGLSGSADREDGGGLKPLGRSRPGQGFWTRHMFKRQLAVRLWPPQDRGEIAVSGQRNDLLPDEKKIPATSDLGLAHKDIHEARQIRDAEETDPGITRRALNERIEARRSKCAAPSATVAGEDVR
jgi:hypothetical protein